MEEGHPVRHLARKAHLMRDDDHGHAVSRQLEPIQGGSILVDGTEVHARGTDLNRLRRKIGIVFQQWNAFPHLTVG